MFIISARHSMTHQTTIDVLEDEFKMDFNNRWLKTNFTPTMLNAYQPKSFKKNLND